MILPNCDPGQGSTCTGSGNTFVNTTTGAITFPGQSTGGVINEQMTLMSACQRMPRTTCTPNASVKAGNYYPIALPSTALHLCPGCSSSSGGFQQDLECCNASTLTCGQQVPVDYSVNPDPNGAGGPAATGGQCLIHGGPGGGQDSIDPLTQSPDLFIAGGNNPFVGTSIQANDHIMTSDSVVTVPLYDGLAVPAPGSSVTIIGYLQLFITNVDNQGIISATVLNVSGCGNSPAGTPVQGAATSVPVRLIQAP
jgi:hypothetical protein